MWFAAAQDCQSSLPDDTFGNATALGGCVVGRRVGGTANVGEGSRISRILVAATLWVAGAVSVGEEANFVFSLRLLKFVEMTNMITAMATSATKPAHESPAINRIGLCGLVGAAVKGAGAITS